MSLITLEEYKEYASINSPTQDPKLTAMIASVNAFIESYIGRPVGIERPVIERVTPQNGLIFLANYPAPTVASVVIKRYGYDDEIIEEGRYHLDRANGIIQSVDPSLVFKNSPKSVEVSYLAGSTNVPVDLKLAALELTTYYNKREFNASYSSGDGQSIGFESSRIVPSHIKSILDLHRLI